VVLILGYQKRAKSYPIDQIGINLILYERIE